MEKMDIQQYQHESDSWKRLLIFMSDENIHLKERLSEILRGKADQELLLEAERFQDKFLSHDDLVAVLEHDVAAFDESLLKETYLDGAYIHVVRQMHNKIRARMNIIEKRFTDLKLEFNTYLLDRQQF